MVKRVLIYEIATDHVLAEYQINLAEDATEQDYFEEAWKIAINNEIVDYKNRPQYSLQFIKEEKMVQ